MTAPEFYDQMLDYQKKQLAALNAIKRAVEALVEATPETENTALD